MVYIPGVKGKTLSTGLSGMVLRASKFGHRIQNWGVTVSVMTTRLVNALRVDQDDQLWKLISGRIALGTADSFWRLACVLSEVDSGFLAWALSNL